MRHHTASGGLRCTGRALGLIAGLIACDTAHVTMVAITLSPNTTPSADDYYEVFATVGRGAVSVGRFAVEIVDPRDGIDTSAAIKAALDPSAPERVLGYVDGLTATGSPIGGISLEIAADLTGATDVFITREPAGDTDPTPSRDAVAECVLEPGGQGTLACTLLRPGDKTLVVGSVSIVLPDDTLNGF